MSCWAAGRRSSAENAGAGGAIKTVAARAGKRVALGELTNVFRGRGRSSGSATEAKLSSTKPVDVKNKGSFASLRNVKTGRGSIRKLTSDQFDWTVSHHDSVLQKENASFPSVPNVVPIGSSSPGLTDDSVSMEDAMSTCNSIESSDLEFLDDEDSSLAASLHCWADDKLHISDSKEVVAFKWRKHSPISMKSDNISDLDNNYEDPQHCATLYYEIYENLREAETRKMPSTHFVETTQTDMSTTMRAVLIDWLVEVTEEYRLVPDTLYLTVNYIDRYLSVKEINRNRLQLLGVACLLIAAKYEEICPPQVEELCYITDGSYTKEEVLQMEASVLNYLKFEMMVPTPKCFLRRFVRAAQVFDEGSTLHLEFLANYICELSLLEYSLLCYLPSLVAASSVFLARFILKPTTNPWNSSLSYYTQYTPSELRGCVRVLHRLFRFGPGRDLPAIREKYSQHKYKFVAKKYCPPSIPTGFIQDATS